MGAEWKIIHNGTLEPSLNWMFWQTNVYLIQTIEILEEMDTKVPNFLHIHTFCWPIEQFTEEKVDKMYERIKKTSWKTNNETITFSAKFFCVRR